MSSNIHAMLYKKYRKQAKLTQQELADIVDVRRETIIRLESGQYSPSVELVMRIAKVLHVTVEDIFSLESIPISCEESM